MTNARYDIVIAGGGTGGCAAALAATRLGCRVLMTEETIWIGGQLTSQAVPPDEHPWIESYGRTESYRRFRDLVRAYYRDFYPLTATAFANPTLNPGGGWVSALCHEPRVALAVIEAMLAPARAAGLLEIRTRCAPVAAETAADRVAALTIRSLESGREERVEASYFLDATELGDILPLTGAEYRTGAESQAEFGEMRAPDGPAQPDNVQAFTWCFPVGYDPQGEHVIEKPAMYDYWRSYTPQLSPTPWPGPLLSAVRCDPITLAPVATNLVLPRDQFTYFSYRKIVDSSRFQPGTITQDVSLVNWPQNDYLPINVIDKPQATIDRALYEAKQLSLSLLYWMQTEAPRDDGKGQGYPGLMLRPDIVGTDDGLAMAPYFREARRIRAKLTVTEAHIGAVQLRQDGKDKAARFDDSVGLGHYRIDLHPSTGGDNYIDVESRSFQIPLGALIPQRVENLLPACKNIGVTHIANGCYRLHPVEWNIGESAGYLAAWCANEGHTPHQVHENEDLRAQFQALIRSNGIPTQWPAHHQA